MKITPERILAACVRIQPGVCIPVIIEGQIYDTIIDSFGVHRFKDNSILNYMFNHNGRGEPINHLDPKQMHSQMLELNTLHVAFHQGKFSKREWLEFRIPGYSISGFCDLSEFGDWHISNPLWDEGNVLIEGNRISIVPVRIHGEEEDDDEAF